MSVGKCPTSFIIFPRHYSDFCHKILFYIQCGCVLECKQVLITSVKTLSKIKDCYSVVDLYITIHEGDPGELFLFISSSRRIRFPVAILTQKLANCRSHPATYRQRIFKSPGDQTESQDYSLLGTDIVVLLATRTKDRHHRQKSREFVSFLFFLNIL